MTTQNPYLRELVCRIPTPENDEQIVKIGKALSVKERLQILRLLNTRAMNVVEIAKQLDLPISSTAYHIKMLEDSTLIMTENAPTAKGHMRLCSRMVTSLRVEIWNEEAERGAENPTYLEEMPLGAFVDFTASPTCGLADEHAIIEHEDSPRVFYSPKRLNAQLLWMQKGHVTYNFPNHFLADRRATSISFSLELCSETAYYRNNWPSDITIWINGVETATYTSPGDFGGRRGRLTPDWWPNGNTQFGLLKTFTVNETGVFIDSALVDDRITIEALALEKRDYISLTVGIKENAEHAGGINLFGRRFGDYDQDIKMTVTCRK